MVAPKPSAPRVTRCHLGKYWSRDFFQKEAESGRQGVGNPERQQAASSGRQRNLIMHVQCPLPVYCSQVAPDISGVSKSRMNKESVAFRGTFSMCTYSTGLHAQ